MPDFLFQILSAVCNRHYLNTVLACEVYDSISGDDHFTKQRVSDLWHLAYGLWKAL